MNSRLLPALLVLLLPLAACEGEIVFTGFTPDDDDTVGDDDDDSVGDDDDSVGDDDDDTGDDDDDTSPVEDADGDGFLSDVDCDDGDPSVNPGAEERCDGVDTDCDGQLQDDEIDGDGDGLAPCLGDCDDTDDRIFPGRDEVCDGVDSDCDPSTRLEGDTDADGDGVAGCDGDCNDDQASVFPGAEEVCDGFDSDCDGSPGADEDDEDGDGVPVCGGDCDDGESAIYPGAEEACDGIDNDCDGALLAAEITDDDGDGWVACEDCADDDPSVFPGAPDEPGDGVDSNCDGSDAAPGFVCGSDEDSISAGELPYAEGWYLGGSDAIGDGSIAPDDRFFDDVEFVAQEGVEYSMGMSQVDGGSPDPLLWLLNPSCEVIATNDDLSLNTEDARITFVAPVDGIYTIVSSSEDDDEGNYQLSLQVGVPLGHRCLRDEWTIEAGDTIDITALNSNDDIEGGPRGDGFYFDDFEFIAEAGDTATITLTSGDLDTYVYLLDESCTVIGEDDDGVPGPGTDSQLIIDLPADGIYTLVGTSYAAGETGNYEIQLEVE